MFFSPYDMMQQAVDMIPQSDHPSNKIAATLAAQDHAGKDFHVSATNFWPAAIREAIGTDTKIGNASGTVHAETACVIKAPKTKGAQLFITDPPCPNCVKNVAEAGIKDIYIDHKGFDKDFAKRRGDQFASMALRICQRAGITVYRIFRKEKRVETILGIDDNFTPILEKPARFQRFDEASDTVFQDAIARAGQYYKDQAFAVCLAKDDQGEIHSIAAETHPVIGYTSQKMGQADEKYTYLLEPVNRLITNAARKGWAIQPAYIFCSRVPTAREIVNMIGAGYDSLYIGDKETARDQYGLQALQQVLNSGIFSIKNPAIDSAFS